MNDQELIDKTRKAFTRVFGRHVPFDAGLSRLDAAKWTSLKHVELIIALEQEFGVRFDGSDATDMVSIPVVIERLRARLT